MQRYLIVLLGVLLWMGMGWGQDNTAALFLNLPVGARSVGLGGVGVALADSTAAAYFNPSGLALLKRQEILTMVYTDPFATQYGYASYALPLRWGTVAVSYFSQKIDGILRVNSPTSFSGGRPLDLSTNGNFNAGAHYWMLSYGGILGQKVFWGASLKEIGEVLGDYSSTGLALDLGILMIPVDQFRVGVTLQNAWASAQAWNTPTARREPLPLSFKMGFSFLAQDLLLAGDLDFRSEQMTWHWGAEYWLLPSLAFRAGVDSQGQSFGNSLKIGTTQLDVAITHVLDNVLDDWVVRFSLNVQVGELLTMTPGVAISKPSVASDRFRIGIWEPPLQVKDNAYQFIVNTFMQELDNTGHFWVWGSDQIQSIGDAGTLETARDFLWLWTAMDRAGLDAIASVQSQTQGDQVTVKFHFYDARTREDYTTEFVRAQTNLPLMQRMIRKVTETLAKEKFPVMRGK
jgi:hypothetical protein